MSEVKLTGTIATWSAVRLRLAGDLGYIDDKQKEKVLDSGKEVERMLKINSLEKKNA